ncbi:hypothetical protein TrLO_g6484 [Triparma laevis f. longispina]|uniref:Uncharacterized protein n=1 Tax=Triparma laevis f. longispina TaxID=1714387 RepID=A0A9W7CMD0_9STRA|nr:hypothetical protein TrLO_g6484 [Triparma laevis f. longispina]
MMIQRAIIGFLLLSSAIGFTFLPQTRCAKKYADLQGSGPHLIPFISTQPLHSVQGSGVPDISSELDAAKALLAKAKARLANQGKEEETKGEEINESHVKEKTPLGVIADSEAMVRSSEAGEWTGRKIDDMFVDISESELDGDELLEEREKREKWSTLRERDVSASVMGLQRQLHAEDFEKIFSRSNPRIGER